MPMLDICVRPRRLACLTAALVTWLAMDVADLATAQTGPKPPTGAVAPKAAPAAPALPAEDQDLPTPASSMPPPPPPPEPDSAAKAGPNGPAKPSTAPGTTGATVKVTVPSKGASAVPAGQELVNIDFPEPTEIKDIIKAVALWTGKNVILDRNVNGKVQIISPRKVTKEEAYQAFLSALNLLGLTTVETGKVIKIMPVRTAVKGNLKTFLGSSWTPMTDEIITQIVPLKYIDAKEIQSTLSRIVSSNSMIAYQPTNTLIISDSGYKVRRVLDILELLDVQGQQAQVAIVPIRYAEAKSIADKVQEIFKNSAAAKKGSASSGYRSYKIMTDERTNSVIIFGPPRTIADVKALVRKFDIQLDDPSRQTTIHVRPLDYADAKKLASTLSALATGKKNDNLHRPPINLPPPPGMPQLPSSSEISVAAINDDVKIAPEESSNALLITGSHAAYQTINALIRKIDLRRSQVFVEADIVDLNLNGAFKFGTSIFAGRGGPNNTNIATTWQAGTMAPLIIAQATAGVAGAAATSTTTIQQAAGAFGADDMTVGILSGKQVNIAGLGSFSPGALIRLIKNDSNSRLLSSPNILTSNNEEAQIVVGEKLFFPSSETSAQSPGVIVAKPEREEVDLTLNIKPYISHSNYVTMQINLEQNSVIEIDKTSKLPRLSKRKTKQIVTVKNSQTVVISGLVQTREFQSFQKIPLLGDIPIIGWLFRNSTIDHQKSNLMIFLTPHIIHGADDLAAVYKQKLDERDELLSNMFGANHIKDDFYALLPTKEDGEYQPDEADKMEKQRREEMLHEMYEGAGMNPEPVGPPKEAAPEGANNNSNNTGTAPASAAAGPNAAPGKGATHNAQKAKVDDSPTYVPLSDGGDGGDGGGGAPDAPEPPPPPEPPPEG